MGFGLWPAGDEGSDLSERTGWGIHERAAGWPG